MQWRTDNISICWIFWITLIRIVQRKTVNIKVVNNSQVNIFFSIFFLTTCWHGWVFFYYKVIKELINILWVLKCFAALGVRTPNLPFSLDLIPAHFFQLTFILDVLTPALRTASRICRRGSPELQPRLPPNTCRIEIKKITRYFRIGNGEILKLVNYHNWDWLFQVKIFLIIQQQDRSNSNRILSWQDLEYFSCQEVRVLVWTVPAMQALCNSKQMPAIFREYNQRRSLGVPKDKGKHWLLICRSEK